MVIIIEELEKKQSVHVQVYTGKLVHGCRCTPASNATNAKARTPANNATNTKTRTPALRVT